jgi:hypothetical protein
MIFKKLPVCRWQNIALVLSCTLFSQLAFCFPEMVRHGYVNCITCHVSPTGGGTLTLYGRELSREVLSTFGTEKESKALFGTVEFPSWILMGGDVRYLQFYQNTATIRQAGFIPMQIDAEAAVSYNQITVDATVGPQESPQTQPDKGTFFSRRHFVNYKATEQISVRGGKFFPAFGINLPDHIPVTKRGLGWDENGETYNLELAYLGDQINIYGTGIFGRPDAVILNRETGGSLTLGTSFLDKYKAGVSYFHGTNNVATRDVAGPWGILGLSPHCFILSEFDFQHYFPQAPSSSVQWGLADYQKFDYEFIQGVHAFITQEYSQLDFQNALSITRIYGAGLQFFPRPHFEFQAVWEKQQMIAMSSDYNDFAWLLFHFYL